MATGLCLQVLRVGVARMCDVAVFCTPHHPTTGPGTQQPADMHHNVLFSFSRLRKLQLKSLS